MASVRSCLYLIARTMGDYNAIRRGTVGKRILRRATGRMTGPDALPPAPMPTARVTPVAMRLRQCPCS